MMMTFWQVWTIIFILGGIIVFQFTLLSNIWEAEEEKKQQDEEDFWKAGGKWSDKR